jgi:hypothetical protein
VLRRRRGITPPNPRLETKTTALFLRESPIDAMVNGRAGLVIGFLLRNDGIGDITV